MFEAFAESDYRRFWTTQFISNIGSWMQAVAQGWLVYHLTDSPFLLGFVGFANSLPAFFLMLPGGVLADQLDRRKVLRLSQWTQALCAFFLALSIHTNQISVWQIIAAAIINGTAMSFSGPAYQAMVVDLLDDRTRLPNAVAMNSLQFNLSRAIGPLLAGLTLAAWGSFWCFLFNALSFLPLIWVLRRLKDRQQYSDTREALWGRLVEGFRFVRESKMVLLLLAVAAAASLFGYPYLTLMPMVARSLFRNDASGLGFLMGSVGGGSLLAALALSIRMPEKNTTIPLILGSLTLFGIALGLTPFLHTPPLVMAMLSLCGLSAVVCMALCNTGIQERVPDAMRGRVLSMYTFAFSGFLPFGNLLAGVLAEHHGISTTLAVLGAGLLVSAGVAAVGVRWWRGRVSAQTHIDPA
jgi:MFS family permease